MKLLGRFNCKACKLYCTVDRFEVAGRRFPFGGRCSLYENVWKRKARSAAAPDLVEERSRILFAPPPENGIRGGAARAARIGIPRALTSHSLYPLYATFFSRLGMDVLLSDVDPQGELKAQSGFCFPAQMAHGAVLDLMKKGVELVFFPHVSRMPNPARGKDSYLCPVSQAGPYVVTKAFPEARFLSPELDLAGGYASGTALIDVAMRELGVARSVAEEAFEQAVAAQEWADASLVQMGRRSLEQALAKEEPTILLVGRSYNAFTPEASQSVGKKLASMGITAIPADCLAPSTDGTTAWHFPNTILNAVALVKKHPNLFLLYVSNFSCTIDAFTHALLSAELGAKPYLLLEIDSHTADAGIQTRLEAFLDILANYRVASSGPRRAFQPARLVRGGRVIASSGEEVSLKDPRVKIYFPAFSEYHSDAWTLAARWLGLHPGTEVPLSRQRLERGLQSTSGRECLPLPLLVGQLLEIHERRQPSEIAGVYMIRGGAPCATDAFMEYLERFIAGREWPDLFVLSPHEENEYCGFDLEKLSGHFSAALALADILVEIQASLGVVGLSGSVKLLKEAWRRFVSSCLSLEELDVRLPGLGERIAAIPRSRDLASCPRVVVIGDFFTRFSPFFMEGVPEIYAQRGIILEPAELGELALYAIYDGLVAAAHTWGLEPGYWAMAKACTHVLRPEGKDYLARFKGYRTLKRAEERYRKVLERTGLLSTRCTDISRLFEEASKHISPTIFGEAIPTVGRALEAEREGYEGILLIGPFNCLPFRVSEAILKPVCQARGIPLLSYESDGYAVSPSFLRQVDVHVHQVLERHLAMLGTHTPLPSASA